MDSMRKLAIVDYLEREREREEEEEMEEEEMEEEVMHKLAMIYYAKMSNDQKQSILSLFKKIDANGDGKVNVQEFFGMFIPGGNEDLEELFMFLDKNGDGTLDFEECVTFFYMIISNRLVWCDGCGSLLAGVYFLCVECYNVNREKTYDLCCSCYSDNNFSHAHAYFLDNYALLREKEIKNYTPGQAGSTRSNIPSARNYTRGQAGSARSKLGKIVDLADTLSNYEDMEGLVDTMAGLAHTTLSKSGSTSQGSKHEKIKDGVQSFLTGYRIASIASHAPAAAHVATHAFAACAIM